MANVREGSGLGFRYWLPLAALLAAASFAGFQLTKAFETHDQLAEISARHDLALQWKVDTRVNLTRTLAIAKSGNLQSLADYLKPQMTETSAKISELQKAAPCGNHRRRPEAAHGHGQRAAQHLYQHA